MRGRRERAGLRGDGVGEGEDGGSLVVPFGDGGSERGEGEPGGGCEGGGRGAGRVSTAAYSR